MPAPSASSAKSQGCAVPAIVMPYLAALGEDRARDFLLKFGGQELTIPARLSAKSPLVREVGEAGAVAFREQLGAGKLRVPMARRWVAVRLEAIGVEPAEIAKRLRVTRESVRHYLAKPKAGA